MRRLALIFLLTAIVFAQTKTTTSPTTAKPAAKTAAATPTATKEPQPTVLTATIQTTMGNLVCQLFPDKTPMTVANFIGLATGTKDWIDPKDGKLKQGVPLYDGVLFHRVIPNFMVQTGDPSGTGSGFIGYFFMDEFKQDLRFDRPGRMAMANAGSPNGMSTNSSQFFITEVPTLYLNDKHTIFGQCDDASIELVKKITRVPRDSNDRPNDPIKILHVTFAGPGAPAAATAPAKPAAAKPAAKPTAKSATPVKK